MVVGLVLLVICLIGLSFVDKEVFLVKEEIFIVKVSMFLYDILMKDGKIIINDIYFDYDNVMIWFFFMVII